MLQNTKRYVVFNPEDPNTFPSASQVNTAFAQIKTISKELKLKKEVTLLIEKMDIFPDKTMSTALSPNVCTILKKECKNPIPYDGMALRLHTPITIKKFKDHEIVLAYCPDVRCFDTLNSIYAKAIIVVPFNQETISEWRNTWDDIIEVDSTGQYLNSPIRNTDLDSCMSALTGRIKPVAKLTIHNSVNRIIIEQHLPANTYTASEIESAAIRCEWSPKEAKALAKKRGIRE